MIYMLNICFLSLELRISTKNVTFCGAKWTCDIFFSFLSTSMLWPIIFYMKVVGTMKREKITEALIGNLKLRNIM